MAATQRLGMPLSSKTMREVIVLTHDARGLGVAVERAGRPTVVVSSVEQLESAAQSHEWSDAVIDRAHPDAAAALAQLAGANAERRVLLVVKDAAGALPGARLIVSASVIARAISELASARAVRPPSASLERLLAATVVDGPLDDPIDAPAHEIAVAFGVGRCLGAARAGP